MAYERIMGLNVIDEAEYQKYRAGMEPILNSMGGAFGFDFRVSEVLRSKSADPINRVFTIDFPSEEVMNQFFSHPDYLILKEQYLDHAVSSRTIISMHKKSD